MEFKGVDFYNTDSLLTEEELMVRKMVREFVDKEVMPIINDYYERSEFPMFLISKMGELGLYGANIEGYDCAGLNNIAYGLIMQELERGDSAIRSFVSVQSGLVMYPILEYGNEEQKKYYLPKLAQGKLIGCFGLTEQDYGSNPGGLITAVRKDNKHYIINGEKMWITNGTIADIAIVWAKDENGVINGFIVEKGTPGFTAISIKKKISLRASDTAELVFEDCKIPIENHLPKAVGLKAALKCLSQARYGIAWGAIGAAMACFDEALRYAKTRIQFDKPIASFQLVQNKLVYMLTEITKAQLLCIQLGRLKDKKLANHVHISLAKRNNVEIALKISRMARDILGASGITLEYNSMRHMCNLESVYTYEGTHDIHTLIIGADITGIESYK
jgi:glutaryl-CoA dehydrogenase